MGQIFGSTNKDTETSQVVTDCLGVSLILRKIFQHFSTTELLRLSRVNKLWSYEARSLLRERATLTATLGKKTCQDFRCFQSDLRRTKEITKVLPISGMTIELGGLHCNHIHGCFLSTIPKFDPADADILDEFKWKHLTVRFGWDRTEELITCPKFLLLKTILEKFGSMLEEFTLGLLDRRADFMQELIQGSCTSFSRLQIFKLENSCDPNNKLGYTNLIKALVSRAPNLRVLHTFDKVNLNENLLEGSSAVHVSEYPFSPFGNEIPEGAIGRLRLKGMGLDHFGQDLNVKRFNRIAIGILEASCTTMTCIHMDAVFLAPLTAYGIGLESVTLLWIHLDLQKLETMHPRVLRLVKCFDFTRTFPKVKAVKLKCFSNYNVFSDAIDKMVEQGIAAFREPMPDRAVNIINLRVEGSRIIKDSTCRFLAEMFPNTITLSIQGTEIPFGRIWECWRDLETLRVDYMQDGSVVQNLDSDFCGIFPGEVAELREQDDEYLKAVHIVPVMPSITCLKGLRNFNLSFCASMGSSGADPTQLFSKVTTLIVFQSCPDLTTTLTSYILPSEEMMSVGLDLTFRCFMDLQL